MDALLQNARELLGTMSPTQLGSINCDPESMPTPVTWDGPATADAAAASEKLDQGRRQFKNAHQTLRAAVTEADQISRDAHTGLRAIETGWANDKAALAPHTNTPEGQAALLTAGQQRVREATQLVQTAAQRFQGASQQVSVTTADLQSSSHPDGSHIRPAGSDRTPGWTKPQHQLDLDTPGQPG